VISTFQKLCDENGKLFLSEPRQEELIKSLLSYYNTYYSEDILRECIVEFIKTADDPILVYDFAIESSKVRDKVVERQKSRNDFDKLVKETEERMRNFDEL